MGAPQFNGANDGWEEINIPRGSFFGWGDNIGQRLTGEVMDFGHDNGTDFDGKPCPQVSVILTEEAHSFSQKKWVKHGAGELVTMNAGQTNLKKGVVAANLNPGDIVRIALTALEPSDKGNPVKVFTIHVKRGTGQLSSNAQRAMQAAAPQQDPYANVPPPTQAPWEQGQSAPVMSTATGQPVVHQQQVPPFQQPAPQPQYPPPQPQYQQAPPQQGQGGAPQFGPPGNATLASASGYPVPPGGEEPPF